MDVISSNQYDCLIQYWENKASGTGFEFSVFANLSDVVDKLPTKNVAWKNS